MLPKSRRLTRQQFWQVSRQGTSVTGSQLAAKYLANNLDYSRWAVVTSAKLDKRAVVRNKLRRRIYLAVSSINLQVDIIMFPKAGMINLDDEKFRLAIDQMVSKISLLLKWA